MPAYCPKDFNLFCIHSFTPPPPLVGDFGAGVELLPPPPPPVIAKTIVL